MSRRRSGSAECPLSPFAFRNLVVTIQRKRKNQLGEDRMDYTLTEEQEQLRKLVTDFVAGEVKPYLEKHGKEEFPWPLFRKLGELGLAAIPFPAEYGGGGLDYMSYALVLEELTRLGSHLGGLLAVHGLPQLIINEFGSAEQKQKYLPAMARAEL